MAKKKDIRIGFYGLTGSNPDGSPVDFGQLFQAIHPHMSVSRTAPKLNTRYRTVGSYDRAIYEVVQNNAGNWIGALGKYRDDSNPIQVDDTGSQTEVALTPHGALLERNFFLYVPSHSVLVFHEDGHGSTPKVLTEYLNLLFEQKSINCEFTPLFTKDALRKLEQGQFLHRLEIKIARPTDPKLYKDLAPEKAVQSLGGDSNNVLTIDMVSRGKGHWLPAWVKAAADRVFKGEPAEAFETFNIEVSHEDGTGLMEVDMLKERLKTKSKVELNGNNLPPFRVYAELDRAREQFWSKIVEVMTRDGLVFGGN